jgi:hypothetical protein
VGNQIRITNFYYSTGYVECATYEDCRDYLQKHPELITKPLADEMYEKAFLTLKTHSPEFGARFARNAQIIQYLLDIRKVRNHNQFFLPISICKPLRQLFHLWLLHWRYVSYRVSLFSHDLYQLKEAPSSTNRLCAASP